MQGLKVGHYTAKEEGTGLSVFLFEKKARGSYLLCGAGPASHELGPLEVDTSVNEVHGLCLSGGSAYGLFAAQGVMQYLREQNVGLTVPHGVIPIVPAAAIYDLTYKSSNFPNAENAYNACFSATENNTLSGSIGAGTGATVGKLIPTAIPMTGGLGYAELNLPNGVAVLAYAVVNAVGDIYDEHNKILAGASLLNGSFVNCASHLQMHGITETIFPTKNTTLLAIFTNANFTKSELKRISKMAVAGMARAISPIFTCYDGDMIFCFSLGEKEASVLSVGVSAAEAARLAIVRAVQNSKMI